MESTPPSHKSQKKPGLNRVNCAVHNAAFKLEKKYKILWCSATMIMYACALFMFLCNIHSLSNLHCLKVLGNAKMIELFVQRTCCCQWNKVL